MELQKILKSEPDDGLSYKRLAMLNREEGRFDDARQELEKARSLSPDDLEIPYQQALLESTVGNDDKAIEILQGLVKQSERPGGQYTVPEANNRALFLERLGLVYRDQEKFSQAMDTFKQIQALGPLQGPRAEMLIIETLRMQHQPDKAMAEAEAAVKAYPKNQDLAILHATMLGERGHVDEAVAQLQPFLTDRPIDRGIYISIAQIYLQAKRFDAAEQAIQKALDLSPNPEDQEYVLFVQGSIFERQKKYDQAEQTFKKVLSVDPLNASASNYLGYMLADRGVRLEESVKYIQKALELDPNNGAYLDSLGWAYFKMGRYDLAAPPLEKAASKIQDDPDHPRAPRQCLFAHGQDGHGAGGVAARPEGMARSRLQRFRRRPGQAASEATRRTQEPLGAWQAFGQVIGLLPTLSLAARGWRFSFLR